MSVANSTMFTVPATGFEGTTVLIVGDLMLDAYILGDVSRISPEAPVPVVAVNRRRSVPGGAANAAVNIAGLRASAVVAGVCGTDEAGSELIRLLAHLGVDTSAVVREETRPTTCKTRVMCGNHQIVRLDDECRTELNEANTALLLDRVGRVLDRGCHAVILSDYAKGVLSSEITASVIKTCAARSIPVLVDPKRLDYRLYAGATCVTPNLKEFRAAATHLGLADTTLEQSGAAMLASLSSEWLLVTQGADGMTLFGADTSHHFPALAEEVFDVSGAGDTVISTLATALGSGLDMVTAVQLSNLAASIVVRKVGTAAIEWADLQALIHEKAPSLSADQVHFADLKDG